MPTQGLASSNLRILLVEDNADDAFLLERHLRKAGYQPEITRVETTAEYVRSLSASPRPSVVIADYNLPTFSGPEALHLLRGSGLDLPFIMMSGAMSEETAVASMRAGAQDYVTKQNLTRLVPALERELREAEARRSRRAAEAALVASEARFHQLVDAMPIGLLLTDATGRIAYANEAAGPLLGQPTDVLVSGHTSVSQFGVELTAARPGETRETSFTRADGSIANVLWDVASFAGSEDSGDRAFAVFLVDLTAQKKGEEVLRRTEKLAVAGRLAASIAHEINNPLAAVTNCLFLVANTELTTEGRTFLDMAQKELDRVAQITVQTLRFHRQSSRPVHSDLRDLIETVLALFESRLRRQEIEVHCEFKHARPVLAFEGEIRQVIVNLLGNAIDASGTPGSIMIRTRQLRVLHRDCEGIVLTIADRGCGIAADVLAHLFEPFFSTKGITGTGLGLWVSKEIVERHGGSIRVHSRPHVGGKPGGTTFRIFLPLGGVPTPASTSEAAAAT